MRNELIAGVLAGMCLGATSANATTGPFSAGGYSIMLNEGLHTANGYNTFSDFGSHSDVADNGSRIDVTLASQGGGAVEITGSGNTESEVGASMSWRVRIDGSGPVNGMGMVEMRLTSRGETSTTGYYGAQAGIFMSPDPLNPFDYYLPIAFSYFARSCSGSLQTCTTGLAGADGWNVVDAVFYMLPNRDYTLTMSAGIQQIQPDHYAIQAGGGTPRTGTARAYVDPIISIAPGVTGYALSSSFPVAPVPEPASWLMLVTGLGAAGGLARRHRLSRPPARRAAA